MRAGGWENSALVTSYLLRLPRQYMRSVAGFGSTAGSYHLKRAVPKPSDSLLQHILPWVDVATLAYASNKILPADLAGREFLGLLRELRVVFLQDSAILQPLYPGLGLWRHAVFNHPEWYDFAAAVRRCEEVEEEPADQQMRAVVPTIAEAVHRSTNQISSLLVDSKDAVVKTVGDLGKVVGDLGKAVGDLRRGQASLSAQLAALQQTVNAQQRRRPEALVVVPPDAVKENYFTGGGSSSAAVVSDAFPLGVLSLVAPAAAGPSAVSVPAPAAATSNAVLVPAPAAATVIAVPGNEARPAGCPEGCPVDPIATSMRSVEEVWREWFFGLERVGDGGRRPSLVELDRRFGSKWRYSSPLNTRYFNRKRLVLFIQKKALEEGKEAVEVAVELDGLGHSPDKLIRLLRQGVVDLQRLKR